MFGVNDLCLVFMESIAHVGGSDSVHLMATWGGLLAPLLFSVLSLAGPEPPGNTYIRSVAIHFTVTIKCTAVTT